MAAAFIGAAVPFGFDSGLCDIAEEGSLEDMTAEQFDQMLDYLKIEASNDAQLYSTRAASEAPKSPGKQSMLQSSACTSSSRSPGAASQILTPSSTTQDYHGEAAALEDPEASDSISTSPETFFSHSSEGYVHVRRSFNIQPEDPQGMNTRPPRNLRSGPGSSRAHYFRASVAPSSNISSSPWSSFNTVPPSDGGWMEQPRGGQWANLHVPLSGSYDEELSGVTDSNTFDPSLLAEIVPLHDVNTVDFSSSFPAWHPNGLSNDGQHGMQSSSTPQQSSQYYPVQQQMQSAVGFTPVQSTAHLRVPSLLPPRQHGASDNQYTRQQQPVMPSNLPRLLSTRSQLQPRVSQTVQQSTPRRPPGQQHPAVPQETPMVPSTRNLQPAVSSSARTDALPSQIQTPRKIGGRKKHSHLEPPKRDKSHRMRRTGACWRCALQRDPCPDENTPCGRCVDKARKGQVLYFGCDRSKLPDFTHDFLPPSMTYMHQKQTIEDTVGKEVARWDRTNCIDVYLTSGYGPALRWKLYEFQPRSRDCLVQFQYLQDVSTGQIKRYMKYSPPFALLKLDGSDEHQFETYLDRLMQPDWLWDFGWTFYEEETQVDDFQARLVEMLCNLYGQTTDPDLHDLLQKVIRMMIITYIMGHTLTISEDTKFGVLDSIRLSYKPASIDAHTSPRLATRQLKFFFCILRNQVYENILNWQQQTLHASGKKEATWLPAFVVMLGFAMTLEEVQRTIHIQADAKAKKGEMDAEQANVEAINACERIDARFDLLVGLYQCKYRDRKWGENGTFGPSTPEFAQQSEINFLRPLYMLLLEKREHLESRKDVPLHPDNQCKYTSRLVARFLLPFLGLP